VRAILDRGAADRHDQHDHHRRTGGDAAKLDARADWQSSEPRCSAILDGPYRSRAEFPSWFVNLLNALRPESSPGALGILSRSTSTATSALPMQERSPSRRRDDRRWPRRHRARDSREHPARGRDASIRLHAMLTGEDWKLVPLWNGRDAWTAARLTVTAPGWIDRFTSRAIAIVIPAIVLLLLTAWLLSALARHGPGPALAWTIVLTAICATAGIVGRFEREVTLLLAASVIVPVARRRQNIGAAFFLLGIPWLALFVAESWPQIGRVTVCSLATTGRCIRRPRIGSSCTATGSRAGVRRFCSSRCTDGLPAPCMCCSAIRASARCTGTPGVCSPRR
jgi:hypothetical protein